VGIQFTMDTTRTFLAIFIVVTGSLAVILFLISGLGQVLRWLRGKKGKPAAVNDGGKEAAMRELGAKPAFSGLQEYQLVPGKEAAELDVYSDGRRIGSVLLGEEWAGARLLALHLLPNERQCALELRPMKARQVGALCSILDCGSGTEVGAVGTLYRNGKWSGVPPKPIYGSSMELTAQIDEIESRGGLLSAALFDAEGGRIGRIARLQDGKWDLSLNGRIDGLDHKSLIACAAQLAAELAGK